MRQASGGGAARRAVDWFRLGTMGATLLRAATAPGPVALGLFIGRNKQFAVACEAAGSTQLFARVHKVDKGGSADAHAIARHLLLRLLSRPGAERITLFVWGYADIEVLGVDLSDHAPNLVRLETGLLGLGPEERDEVFSYVADRRAPYFDGRVATDLEALLQNYESGAWRRSAGHRAFVERAKAGRIQKYRAISGELSTPVSEDDVVVVGQVTGDMAWQETITTVADNVELVAAARKAFGPGRRILYKAHPFNPRDGAEREDIRREHPDIAWIDPRTSFAEVAARKPTIVVCTSGAGFEAALAGAKVVCFGAAFYAGWGATEDHVELPRRTNRLTPEDILFVLGHEYCRYGRRQADGTAARIAPLDFLDRVEERVLASG